MLSYPHASRRPHSRVRPDIAARFALLADTWERETRFFSDNERILTHPAYQQIIGMGPFALPFILNRLRKRGGHWSWALMCITGEDPVDPAHALDPFQLLQPARHHQWVHVSLPMPPRYSPCLAASHPSRIASDPRNPVPHQVPRRYLLLESARALHHAFFFAAPPPLQPRFIPLIWYSGSGTSVWKPQRGAEK